MRNEFAKFKNELPVSVKQNVDSAIIQYNNHGYIGNSKYFLDQFWKNISDIKYLELHGGEPTADKTLWNLVERVVESGHSKHMHIHVHTNIHNLTERHVDLWDQFKSGWIGVSIDAYAEENEYIRYGSNWDVIERNLKLLNRLGSHWSKWITSSVMAYNSCTMHRLINWFINYVDINNIKNVSWRMDTVVNPNLVRIEHVPMHLRLKAVDKLIPLIGTSDQQTNESILNLINALKSTQLPQTGSYDEFIEYTKVLDKKRNQNVSITFPHLTEMFV